MANNDVHISAEIEELTVTLGVGREQIYPELQEKSVEPTTSVQTIQPDEDYYGLNKVVVNAVTSEIDDNIQANNIRSGVSILGVNGNLEPDKPDQTKSVTPTTQAQVITPDLGYELSQVNIEAVTNEIDSNIQAENIKEGVTILGVTGTVQEGIDTSDANATAPNVLTGKTAYVQGEKVTGTMPNNETLNYSVSKNVQTIPQGYTDGGQIDAMNLQIKTVAPSTQAQAVEPDAYFDGLDRVNIQPVTSSIDNNIQANNIKAGVNILNTQGSFTSDGNVTAEEIAEDKIAYANGQKIVGTRESVDTTIDSQDDLIEQLQEEINNKSGISAMRSNSIPTRHSFRKNRLLQRGNDNRNSRYS